MQDFASWLGARTIPYHKYLESIIAGLGSHPSEDLYPEIRDLLLTVTTRANALQGIDPKSYAIVPDRTGRLRLGSELYSDQVRLFASTFEGEDTSFPHEAFRDMDLAPFGVQDQLSRVTFQKCVQHLVRLIQQGEITVSIWSRCNVAWQYFNAEQDRWHFNAGQDRGSGLPWGWLCYASFVPVWRPEQLTYRDRFIRSKFGQFAVAAIIETIHPIYMRIAWTQRPVAHSPPAVRVMNHPRFAPSVREVVEHLVELSTAIATKCLVKQFEFFLDLEATYDYLNQDQNVDKASQYIRDYHATAALWLDEDTALSKLSFPSVNSDLPITTLRWLNAQSIIHGVPYDLPERKIYSAKESIERYGSLLRKCGSLVVQDIKPKLRDEKIENHGNRILGNIREMLKESDGMCDLIIEIEGRRINAHKLLLGTVSSFFRNLACGQWKESSTGVLNLDDTQGEPATAGAQTTQYGGFEAVQAFVEWTYNGFLELDDGAFPDETAIEERLNHYLDVLKLADMWDIPELRVHIENRIMQGGKIFIRPENVKQISELATEYRADELVKYCGTYTARNQEAVNAVMGPDIS